MNYSDETLMAFADGELDPLERAEIEAAMAADAGLAARVAEHRALREHLQRAYAAELEQPVPERLLEVLSRPAGSSGAAAGGSRVVALGEARARKTQTEPARTATRALPRWTALAASLLVGVAAGYLAFRATPEGPVTSKAGVLIADASLARTLSHSLSGESGETRARIGLSYRAKSGELCRSFTERALAGIACRAGGEWRIRMLAQVGAGTAAEGAAAKEGVAPGGYRTAASELPAALRAAIDADIDGEPLDANAERAARKQGWRSP